MVLSIRWYLFQFFPFIPFSEIRSLISPKHEAPSLSLPLARTLTTDGAFNQMYWHHIKTVFQFETVNLNLILCALLFSLPQWMHHHVKCSMDFFSSFSLLIAFRCAVYVCVCSRKWFDIWASMFEHTTTHFKFDHKFSHWSVHYIFTQ